MLWLCLLLASVVSAKVDPPNYDFSVDTLAAFFPGVEITSLEGKYGKPEVLSNEGETQLLRWQVAQPRYVFPVLVQAQGGKIVDMHARLPPYFLHNIFHQSMINRWGKQAVYKRVDEEAFYQWTVEGRTLNYGASCTITCFPVWLGVVPVTLPEGFKTIRERLRVPASQPR
jgi:hypothetical protein